MTWELESFGFLLGGFLQACVREGKRSSRENLNLILR